MRAKGDIETLDDDARTPLCNGALGGHTEVCKTLVEAKASIEASSLEGMTPLHGATMCGRSLELVEYLLEAKSDITSEEVSGGTALGVAAFQGHRELASLLVKKGSKVNAVNSKGYNALMLAAIHGHGDIVEAHNLG